MVGVCLGLDIGTTNMYAFVPGKGIALSQSSAVACDKSDGHVIAVGDAAAKMIGRTPGSIVVRFPFSEGVAANIDLTRTLISSFIDTYCGDQIVKPNIICSVPSNLTSLEKKTILDILFQSGARKACLLPKPFAAAIGADVRMKVPSGVMVVDIGGGSTECAVLTMDKIAVDKTLKVGSDELNKDIQKYLRREKNIEIGYETSEKIKREIGCAVRRDEELALILTGVDTISRAVVHFEVTSSEVYFACRDNIKQIVNAVCDCLSEAPPDLAGDVIDSGITLTGGGSQLFGLDKRIAKKTGVFTSVAVDPSEAVVRGLARTAKDINRVKKSGFALKYLAQF